MPSTPGILYVTMAPSATLTPAQFHDWYNNDHGPGRLRLPFCSNGFRYRASDLQNSTDNSFSPAHPEWMAIYDITDMATLTSDTYTRLRAPPVQAQRERDTMKQITVDRRFYDFVSEWKADDFRKLEDVENEGEGNVLVSVGFTLHEGQDKEDELKKWYDEEHVHLLSKVPGWRRTRRFVTSYLDLEAGKTKEFLAIHEYAPKNGLGGPEFKAAISTKWNDEIYKTTVKEKRRRVYDLYYTFGPAPRDLASLDDKSTFPTQLTDGLTKSYPTSSSPTSLPLISSYITTPDGVQLPYTLTGNSSPTAPTLLLINSILVTSSIWSTFIPTFHAQTSQKYRILTFNTRGRSSLPSTSTSPITIHTLSTDIITLLDHLRIKTASLVGVSLGGATALNTALTYPDRISAFVACDTNSLAPPGNPKAWGERITMAENEGLKSSGTGEPIVGQDLAEATVRRWFVKASYEDGGLKDRIEEVKQMVATNSLDGFKKSVEALYEYDFRPQMKEYAGKGAFLVGAGDGVLPKTMADMAQGLGVKGTHLEVVDGAGHLPMVEKPEAVAGFVARFLEG